VTTSDDVHTLSGAYALDALDPEEAAEFRAHLEGCAACRQEVQELRGAAARMGAVETLRPPPELRARVLAAADRTPQVPPAPRAEGSGVTSLRRPSPGAPARGRRWNRLAMAAATLVVVGGGAIGVSQVLDDPPDTAATPAERVFEAADARTLGEPTENGGTLLVAVSPSRDEMAVDTSELPALAGNRVYQLWTLEGEAVESAGVFDEPGGTAAMALPEEGVRVAVTIEPAGGSELPTSTPIVQVEPAAV
jgi:anti-sigma factor RsiW